MDLTLWLAFVASVWRVAAYSGANTLADPKLCDHAGSQGCAGHGRGRRIRGFDRHDGLLDRAWRIGRDLSPRIHDIEVAWRTIFALSRHKNVQERTQ